MIFDHLHGTIRKAANGWLLQLVQIEHFVVVSHTRLHIYVRYGPLTLTIPTETDFSRYYLANIFWMIALHPTNCIRPTWAFGGSRGWKFLSCLPDKSKPGDTIKFWSTFIAVTSTSTATNLAPTISQILILNRAPKCCCDIEKKFVFLNLAIFLL